MTNRILTFILIISLVSCHPKKYPVLYIDTALLEKINDTTKHSSFIIENKGNGILVIEDFVASCECTVLKMHKGDSILPGKSLVVPITIERDGKKEKKIIVVTLRTNTIPKLSTIKVII